MRCGETFYNTSSGSRAKESGSEEQKLRAALSAADVGVFQMTIADHGVSKIVLDKV